MMSHTMKLNTIYLHGVVPERFVKVALAEEQDLAWVPEAQNIEYATTKRSADKGAMTQ